MRLAATALLLGLLSASMQAAGQSTAQRLELLERRVGRITDLTLQLDQVRSENQQLRGEIERLSYEIERLKRKQRDIYLDIDQRVRLRPDLSWWTRGRCEFVGDVKYKRTVAGKVLHPDLYQLLAYTIATDLPGALRPSFLLPLRHLPL